MSPSGPPSRCGLTENLLRKSQVPYRVGGGSVVQLCGDERRRFRLAGTPSPENTTTSPPICAALEPTQVWGDSRLCERLAPRSIPVERLLKEIFGRSRHT